MRKVDPSSSIWMVIAPHIEARMDWLKNQLCGGTVKHEEGKDSENRARLKELEKLVSDLTTEKQTHE